MSTTKIELCPFCNLNAAHHFIADDSYGDAVDFVMCHHCDTFAEVRAKAGTQEIRGLSIERWNAAVAKAKVLLVEQEAINDKIEALFD